MDYSVLTDLFQSLAIIVLAGVQYKILRDISNLHHANRLVSSYLKDNSSSSFTDT